MKNYIEDGERIEVNIPFPEYNANIKGLLTSLINEKVWVKIEHIT